MNDILYPAYMNFLCESERTSEKNHKLRQMVYVLLGKVKVAPR